MPWVIRLVAHGERPVDAWLFRHAHAQSWGTAGSVVLETAYVLTYAIPPAAVAILYVLNCRDRVDRFHRMFFSGTLVAYALPKNESH